MLGSGQPIRVLVVDDHPSIREGLRHSLVEGGALVVAGEAATVGEAVLLGRVVDPDVVLLDLVLPDAEGAKAVQLVVEGVPRARILILSGTATPARVRDCLHAGASGFLDKSVTPAQIRDGIERVAAGQRVVDPSLVSVPLEDPVGELTPRELEVLTAISHGLTNRRVALRLGTSENTVKTHLSRAMAKLGAEDRTHAVALLMRRGILH